MPRTSLRRTKIVATLGPAWDTPPKMTSLLEAGVDVVRINASHGTSETRGRWIHELRSVLQGRREAAAVLLDLQGPRIRIGDLSAPTRLEPGQKVVFAPEDIARPGEIVVSRGDLAGARSPRLTTISPAMFGSALAYCWTMGFWLWK